jgi:flagellar basal-body rod protein FlgC
MVFGTLDISTSALVAQRINLEVIAGNVANKDVTRGVDGRSEPFRRRVALLTSGNGRSGPGVHVEEIVSDPAPFPLRWDPQHPDAVRQGPQAGYVRLPNVNYHTEMVNAMTGLRAYEANVTVLEAAKSMAATTLRLIA